MASKGAEAMDDYITNALEAAVLDNDVVVGNCNSSDGDINTEENDMELRPQQPIHQPIFLASSPHISTAIDDDNQQQQHRISCCVMCPLCTLYTHSPNPREVDHDNIIKVDPSIAAIDECYNNKEEDIDEEEGSTTSHLPSSCPDHSWSSSSPACQAMLVHLLRVHHVVIADVDDIADLGGYLAYWKKRNISDELTTVASTIRSNVPNEQQDYFLLCPNVCREDDELRTRLKVSRLETLLMKQAEERKDIRVVQCPFCDDEQGGGRDAVFTHLRDIHGLALGPPDNLVDCWELLDMLHGRVRARVCIYCERTFKTPSVLKAHMRKKKHFRINSANTAYDHFYLINHTPHAALDKASRASSLIAYSGKKVVDQNTSERQRLRRKNSNSGSSQRYCSISTRRKDFDSENEESIGWDDWVEPVGEITTCLFCLEVFSSPGDAVSHMSSNHAFDLPVLRQMWSLDFYDCVKLVNFIRRQVHNNTCTYCPKVFESRVALLEHMKSEGHFLVRRDDPFWTDPGYFFATVEEDPLLWSLDEATEEYNQ